MKYERLKNQIVELIIKEIAKESMDLRQFMADIKLEVSLAAVAMCGGIVDRGAALLGSTRTAVSNRINSYENYMTEKNVEDLCAKCEVPYTPRIGVKKAAQEFETRGSYVESPCGD